jgi:hypothetical protein
MKEYFTEAVHSSNVFGKKNVDDLNLSISIIRKLGTVQYDKELLEQKTDVNANSHHSQLKGTVSPDYKC